MMGYTFISGATGGIGGAFAEILARRGENLFLTGRSSEKLKALSDKLCSLGAKSAEFFACDLASETSRAEMIEFIDGRGIKFSRIIHVAGVDTQKPFINYTEEKILFQMRVNAEAAVSLTHALLERREKPAAEIIAVSSMSGVSPMPYFALYSATKALITNFFTALHYELKKEGVKVTSVLPGGVYTREDVIKQIEEQGLWGRLSAKTPAFVAEKSLKAVKKNRIKYVPGFFNRLLKFIMRILPERWVLSFIARRWKKIEKDAF